MKGLNLEKVKAAFEKADIDEQIDAYEELGKWLHGKITTHQQAIGDRLNELQAKKELIKKD